jgi:hypothetical protein
MDKVTFIEYCSLPGIINERLFRGFDPEMSGLISEEYFITNMISIFMSSIETKMRLTFNM